MQLLLVASTILLITSCVQDREKGLTYQQMKDFLIDQRGAKQVCATTSPECLKWIAAAYQCEQSKRSEEEISFTTGVVKSCRQMNAIQKQASRSKTLFEF
jgi:hypothetical protein